MTADTRQVPAPSEETRASYDPTRAVQVLLVDDHELVRRGLRSLLDQESDLAVAGEAADVAGAMRELRRLTPDVAVVDVRLPDGDGTEVCRAAIDQGTAVLVLTGFDDEQAVAGVLAAGAAGVLLKDLDGARLVDGVRRVAAGETLAPLALRPRGSGRREVPPAPGATAGDAPGAPAAGRPALWRLTPRERAVLDLMGQGLSNRRIAGELAISEKTVKNHVTGMLSKLGVARRTQAVALLLRQRD